MNSTIVDEQKKAKPNPAKNANFISQLCFLYMFPIFKRTFKKEMSEDDIFEPLKEHKSSRLGDQLEIIWREEFRKSPDYALHKTLYRKFGTRFIIYGIIHGVKECLMVILFPISIGKVVFYFQNNQNLPENEIYMYASFIIMIFLMDTFCTHPTFMGLNHICMKMRISCSTLLYRKSLRLNRTSLSKTTTGQIINLLSNDVSKFDEGFVIFHYMWIAPVQLAVGVYLIYGEIQVSAFVGIAFLLLFIPIQIWVGTKTSTLRLKTALRTDERVRLMNEIINGIQVIKMYCWEKPFSKLITLARTREMKMIRLHQYLLGIVYSLEMFLTRTSIFLSLLCFLLLGNVVSAEKVFAITGIYNTIRIVVTSLFAISISAVAECDISVKRINKFLCYDEIKNHEELTVQNLKNGKNVMVDLDGKTCGDVVKENSHPPQVLIENVDASWTNDSEEYDLEKIDLRMDKPELVAVIGPVGSGKSSLIHLILRELTVRNGFMEVHGTISYASQEPWLFSGTIRQNILFGEDYEKDRYEMIVKVCALEHDFEQFANGDRTLVGERGKILSGGQKARINLARCVYKRADIYLLDDPLSAVDVNVGKHLYFQCIDKFLNDKICILITHQLQYIHTAKKILIMEDGKIQQTGTYEELQRVGLDFAALLAKSSTENTENINKNKARLRQQSTVSSVSESDKEYQENPSDREEIEHGSVKFKVYFDFAKFGGSFSIILLVFFLLFIAHVFTFGGDFYVTQWMNLEQDFANSNATEPDFSRRTIIYIYSGIIFGTIIFSLFQTMFLMKFFCVAATKLHNSTFERVINGTMKFFNTNPSGRILNRFSEDMGIVDEYIPHISFDVIIIVLLFIFVIILSSIVEPLMFPASIALVTLFILIRSVYIKTSRNVKRIVAITRSPMYSHITATLNGLTTIRAFKAEKMLIEEFDCFQDRNSSANYLFFASSECFGFWINMISVVFIGIALFLMITFDEEMHGGDIGLILTEFVGLIQSIDWGMRQWSELENHMTSTERIMEYTRIEKEPERSPINTPSDWPSEGRLEFESVSMKYKENDTHVLNDLNFVIKPTEKIGIVGRTGAGKSSIINALFQLYPIEGCIRIDGVDTTKLPLEDLRNKISIIPQEPVLFSGSMRKNLDPFEEYDDNILWNALEQVELKETVMELNGLNSTVSESGTNFSVGERQLVCLARALIRNNKILVLDEATANVDPYTDSLIQKTIRTKFANCTVLTVAHRLNTVMDSDRILVMKSGRVEEFEHPHILLRNEGSLLHSLVKATGENLSEELEKIAEENYQKKIIATVDSFESN